MSTEYVELTDVLVLKETPKAFLLEVDRDSEESREVWVPKSQVNAADSEVEAEGQEGSIFVAEWFAEKEGLV